MASFIGTSGNNTQNGTNSDDTFDYSQGGKDTLSGKGGADVFIMGALLTADDSIDGGNGFDSVSISGNYSAGLAFAAATITNVEQLTLSAGFDYTLTLDNANVTLGHTMTVDASALGVSDDFIFDGSDETSSPISVVCGAGTNTIFMGGGDDTVNGGAAFKAANTINGGTGFDTLQLSGDYSLPLIFSAGTIRNIESIVLTGGHDYNLTLNKGNIDFGAALTVDASALGSGDSLTLDASAIAGGVLNVIGGAGADTVAIGQSGRDVVKLAGGNDMIDAGANFDETLRLYGGGGSDTLDLNGDYSDRVGFQSHTLRGFEQILLHTGNNYNFATSDGVVAAGDVMTIDGSDLGNGYSMTVDGSAESNGSLHFIGGAGNNTLTGGDKNDTFTALSGTNALYGGRGNDLFTVTLDPDTAIDGGAGFDSVSISGDYSAFVSLPNIETLTLGAGFDYNLFVDASVIDPAANFLVDAGSLGASDTAYVQFTEPTEIMSFDFIGGAGNDTFIAPYSSTSNFFDLSHGGDDLAQGGAYLNEYDMGAALTGTDQIAGIGSEDTIVLDGDYTGGNAFVGLSTTFTSIEHIVLTDGHDYSLTMDDSNLIAGIMGIDASGLGVGHAVTFDGSAELDGAYGVIGGAGGDTVTGGAGGIVAILGDGNDTATVSSGVNSIDGGAGDDHVVVTAAGTTSITAGDDNDTIDFGDFMDADDFVNGNDGNDTLQLSGDDYGGQALEVYSVETIHLAASHTYGFVIFALTPTTCDGSALLSANTMFVTADGSLDSVTLKGGAGGDSLTGTDFGDTFIGNDGNDQLRGGAGADSLSGGAGSDDFFYGGVSDSTGLNHDSFVAINLTQDKFHLGFSPSAIDANVNAGNLSTATFDADLAARINAARLAANHAVIFTPGSGSLAGHKFLIVDANGTAGYQAGQDYVFDITASTGTFDTGDFI